MGSIKYPPENIYNPTKCGTLNYDYIILWMLYNNEICEWGDFGDEPIEIPLGTLSRHLDKLKRKGFVDKISRGHYKITKEGKKAFHELLMGKKKARKLNYPPKIILKTGRNYSHWILWMVYNNNYCKRKDFLEDPLSINQSSLSKNLSLLIEKGFIAKEEGKYIITTSGKSKYSRMLQNYDLDRQTILEEESKKIEDITINTRNFFKKYKIADKQIQFNFLNYVLKLDYEQVKSILKKEDVFYKILLYLAMNHPQRYPNFISPEGFSRLYQIKTITLNYYVNEISAGTIYPTKFFKLTALSEKVYYFQTDGKLEKMLEIITGTQINKYSYLNKLFSDKLNVTPKLDVNFIIDQILDECCEYLFNRDFKESLRAFLPKYIKYLSYKIEIKKELKDTYDKLEGIIWQDIAIVFNSHVDANLKSQYEEEIKEIDRQIELDPENIDLFKSKIKILIYFNQYNEVLKVLDKTLEIFPENEIDLLMKKASILKRKKEVEVGLGIIEDLLKKYPKNNDLLIYKALWYQYLDRKDEALKIIQELVEKEPDKGIYHDYYGEILMNFEEYEEAVGKFLKAILLSKNEWFIYQTYIKLGICYKALGNYDLTEKNLKKGKEITKKSSIDPETKQKWLTIADLFLSDLQPLEVNH